MKAFLLPNKFLVPNKTNDLSFITIWFSSKVEIVEATKIYNGLYLSLLPRTQVSLPCCSSMCIFLHMTMTMSTIMMMLMKILMMMMMMRRRMAPSNISC